MKTALDDGTWEDEKNTSYKRKIFRKHGVSDEREEILVRKKHLSVLGNIVRKCRVNGSYFFTPSFKRAGD
jgi:hypothetical protein